MGIMSGKINDLLKRKKVSNGIYLVRQRRGDKIVDIEVAEEDKITSKRMWKKSKRGEKMIKIKGLRWGTIEGGQVERTRMSVDTKRKKLNMRCRWGKGNYGYRKRRYNIHKNTPTMAIAIKAVEMVVW